MGSPSSPPPVQTARDAAFVALREAARKGEFATQVLEESFAKSGLSDADRRLAAELVAGVVRRRGTLDALVQPCLHKPLEEIEGDLRWVLRLGAYQLALLSGIPEHAAVHETVETAKRCGQPRWAGFVNGVLRTLSRLVSAETSCEPSAEAVPLASGLYRRLKSPLLPNPAASPGGYFAAAFGFPAWLVERWLPRFSREELYRLGFWFNSPQPVCLRINRLQTSRDVYLERLRAAGIAASAGQSPESVWLTDRMRVETLPGFAEGEFSVQDESAMGAARLVDPQPGERVLDLCAAPGGKTTHLAELMGDGGRILAADVDAQRLARVRENCRRLGLKSVETVPIRRDLEGIPAGSFDAVLVDVPCSNTGVLGKRPEARWRLTPRDLVELPDIQRGLLAFALARTPPGGRVVYSTCSIEPEENADVVAAILREHPGWTLEREFVYLPGQPADGAYQALLRAISN